MKDKTASQQNALEHFAAHEIDVDLLSAGDLERNPGLLDGFRCCPGCRHVFVLVERPYCSNCTRMFAQYESQRETLQLAQRIDMGIVPHDAAEPDYDPGKPASRWAVRLILFGALCCVMFTLTGLWFVGRGLVGFCLEHTK